MLRMDMEYTWFYHSNHQMSLIVTILRRSVSYALVLAAEGH